MLLVMLATSHAYAACGAPTTEAEIQSAIQSAEVAFAEMDEAAFVRHIGVVDAALPCLGSPLGPGLAAAAHRAAALEAFLARDRDKAVAHFQALLAIEPGYVLNETLAPPGHPLRDDFEAAGGIGARPPVELAAHRGLVYRVDGEVTTEIPTDRPYLFQVIDGGLVISTTMIELNALPRLESFATVEPVERPHRARIPLLVTAALTAASAGACYAVAARREDDFWDPGTPDGELGDLRRETNTYVFLAVGAGAVAVGTGAAAAFTVAW
jgi:hypothetical protein